MVSVSNPLWLWALGGILVPIAIHLLSRKAGKTLPFGSLRFLSETPSSKFHGIRLNEILLLVLRCLAIICLVLFLAGFSINRTRHRERVVLVEDGLEHAERVRTIVDSLVREGFRERSISSFTTERSTSRPDYWSLINHLSQQPLESVVIISRQRMADFRGKRTALPENIYWIQEKQKADSFTLSRTLTNHSLLARKGYTDDSETSFETIVEPAETGENYTAPDSLRVLIRHTDEFSRDKDIIAAALNALSGVTRNAIVVMISADTAKSYDWMITLGVPEPASTEKSITYRENAAGHGRLLLSDTTGGMSAGRWFLTRRLTLDDALEGDLAFELADIMIRRKSSDREKDNRVMPDQMLWSKTAHVSKTRSTGDQPVHDAWIMGLFVVVVAVERIVSKKRRQ